MSPSFSYHQVARHLPKRFALSGRGYPLDPSYYLLEDGTQPAEVPMDDEGLPPESLRYAKVGDCYGDGQAWMKANARKVAPLHRFWWEGDLYAHFTRGGEVLPMDEWNLLSPQEYEAAFKKNRGLTRRAPREAKVHEASVRRDVDQLEVFLSPRHGRMRG